MKRNYLGIFCLFFLVLFGCFKLNPFHVYNSERTFEQIFANKPEDWSKDSESYVVGSLIESQKFGFTSGIGRLARAHVSDDSNWFYNVQITFKAFEEDDFDLATDFEMYYSQLGGQGVLFRIINFSLKSFDGFKRLKVMHNINVVLISIVLGFIALYLKIKFNLIASLFFILGILINQWLPITVTNLYWISWSWFLPMAVSCLYCLIENKSFRVKIGLYLLLFLSIIFKCASGYEFISTVLVAMMLPFVLEELENFNSIFTSIKKLIIPALIGIFGFIFTFILHILRYMMGGWNFKDSIDFIKVIIIKRTNGSLIPLGIDVESWERALSEPYIELIGRYFNASSLNIEAFNKVIEIKFWYVISFIVLFMMVLIIFIIKGKARDKRKAINLMVIVLVSFLAPLSWIILARGHAAAHLLLDPVLFYVPFIPLGMGLVGYTLSNIGGCYEL